VVAGGCRGGGRTERSAKLTEEYQNLKPHVLIDYTFLDTTFGEMENYLEV
jgi:hypothetical protein